MKNIYTSVDIGSDSIKVAVCEYSGGKFNLLAASSKEAKGIKKGGITNPREAAASLKSALNEVELMLGVKIKKVIINVPAYFADFKLIKGKVSVDKKGDPIDGDDIVNVFQKAMHDQIAPGRDLITAMPIDFIVDGNAPILDPKGEVGNELVSRAIMATTPQKNIYSVLSLVESLGIEVVDISLTGIGNINALGNKETGSKAGVIVDIGAETTTVSLYNKNILIKNSIIQLGGKNIDNDLAYIFKIDSKQAKRLKEKFAVAHKNMASNKELVHIKKVNGEETSVSQFAASEVAMSRIEEILMLVKKEINILASTHVDYLVITGGTSNMKNFHDIAVEILGKDVIIGNMKLIGIRNNKYSAVLGNIIYYVNKLKLKGKMYSMFSSHDVEIISSSKKNILNVSSESMLGKVFGYFWNE